MGKASQQQQIINSGLMVNGLDLIKSQEVWKNIPNFNRYQASSMGNIRSLNYKNTGKIKNIKPALTKDGYLQSMFLSDCGKYCSKKYKVSEGQIRDIVTRRRNIWPHI